MTTNLMTEARSGAVVSYERISRFRAKNTDVQVSRGVERQADDARAAAELMGLTGGIEHFTDENQSASKYASKPREAWPLLLARIERGDVSHVLVWLLDRVIRQTSDLDRLLAVCEAAGAVIVQTGTGTVVDPSDDDSVMYAKMLGVIAEYEVAKMSKRQRRRQLAVAESGRPHGGKRRFGYTVGMGEVIESEAAVVREVAGRLLAGESLRSVSADLNRRGIKGTQGGEFTGPNLRHLMARPHLAGIRVHKGTEHTAKWVAILDKSTHRRLVDMFANPDRRKSYSNTRRYLLSGLARCAHPGCDMTMRARPATRRKEAAAYTCRSDRHFHRPVELVDGAVVARVVHQLARMDTAGVLVDADAAELAAEARDELAALEARADKLADRIAAGSMPEDMGDRAARKITDDIRAVTERLAELDAAATVPVDVLSGLVGPCPAESFTDLPLSRQRAVIDALVARVELVGADHGRQPFDPEAHVRIDWR